MQWARVVDAGKEARHARGMSIRIKEWGMMSQPSRGVRMPTDGLTGWGEAARRVGEGFAALLTGTSRAMQNRAQVAAAGELADFSNRLKTIDQETRAELAEQDVQDWNHAWQSASGPKLAEAINELSPGSRQAGQELAAAYNARAALEAQRDYELGRIDKARTQWRNQLENAVQAGDAKQAKEWLEAGQGIFVPEDELPVETQAVESQASLSRWMKQLQNSPLGALSELADTPPEELPGQKQDAQRLAHERNVAQRAAKREVLGNLITCMESGMTPEPGYVKKAEKAGVLTATQAESALAEPGDKEVSRRERREWTRRVDECADGDEAAESLMLDITTADLPLAERKSLLTRLEVSRSLPAGDRQFLSYTLWNMYHNGLFGCPGDADAQARFAELQQESLFQLQQGGRRGAAEWASSLRDSSDKWVCFPTDNQ